MGNLLQVGAAKIHPKAWAGLTLALIVTTTSAVTIAKAQGGHTLAPNGTSCTSQSACITGTNHGHGYGVQGNAASGAAGIKGTSTSGSGVLGTSSSGAGVIGTSSTFYGVEGTSPNYYGVGGFSQGFYAGIGGFNTYTGTDASGVYGQSTNGPGVDGFSTNSYAVQAEGNVNVFGEIYTSGSCKTGCARGRYEASFAARTSQPTIDDMGEAALHNGVARVALAPDFSNVIDPNQPYFVLLTPEGDASLYVANRDANGFEVREVGGGRSSIAFAYRIVAKPYGVRDERLPFHQSSLRAR